MARRWDRRTTERARAGNRRANPRQLTGRPRHSLAKWVNHRPPVQRQTVTPGCWWAIGAALGFIAGLGYLLIRWIA